MPELRKDPVVERWVIIATERARRPMDFVPEVTPPRGPEGCPFCPGREERTPPEIYRSGGSEDGPWTVRVVPNKFPALHGDGGEVHAAGEGIYDRINAATGTVLSRVTANPFGWYDEQPQWSPDGDLIVFTRVRKINAGTEVTALFLVRPDGTDLKQLTQWGMNAASPDWSPDGTKIAFKGKNDPPAPDSIWTIHPDGSGLRALVKATGQVDFFEPKWSPDGTRLIVAARLLSSQSASLWTLDADGSNLTKIATITGRIRFPDWGTYP
jgi:Periplasmic component of the Tol biopolymer transport system